MSRKWIGILVAVVFATFGTVVLVGYVNSAEERALDGQESAEVLVVSAPVPAGSSADEIAGRVATELVPAKVLAQGGVASLQDIAGQVAAVDLVPGEQLLAARFVAPEVYAEMGDFTVPEGMIEVTVSLSPERAVGGALRPGDLVAVFASFLPFDLDGVEPGDESVVINVQDVVDLQSVIDAAPQAAQTPNSTHLIIHKVVVTNVQVERLPTEEDDAANDSAGVALAPTGNLLVTLAMDPASAERLVFTSEFGTVWLAQESEAASEAGTRIQTRNTIYEDTGAEVSP